MRLLNDHIFEVYFFDDVVACIVHIQFDAILKSASKHSANIFYFVILINCFGNEEIYFVIRTLYDNGLQIVIYFFVRFDDTRYMKALGEFHINC